MGFSVMVVQARDQLKPARSLIDLSGGCYSVTAIRGSAAGVASTTCTPFGYESSTEREERETRPIHALP